MIYYLWFKCLDEQEVFLMDMKEKIAELADGFSSSSKMLIAIGDETRQHLILEMMKMGNCSGVRVGEITEKTNLSRPAVSHHLQIMKDTGIVKVRKEGTMNFYYFDPEMAALERLIATLELAKKISQSLPDRSGENGQDQRPDHPGKRGHRQQTCLSWLIRGGY